MAYRVIFWRPRSNINVWLPAHQPLGETIRGDLLSGGVSTFLDHFQADELFQGLKSAFPQSRMDQAGYLHWSDDLGNGFVARCGEQFVDVCSFDLADENLETVFSVADHFNCEHYDWGN